MRKSIKWTLIGVGIFVGIAIVLTATFFISSAVVAVGIEGLSNTMAERVKKEIPEALTEPEIREIIREEIGKTKQIEEEKATEETLKAEPEETTGKKESLQNLITGQEFIYDGVKIALTKYEIVPTNIDKNLLWVYLYVENIDSIPHEHIYGMEFVIYHKGREAGQLVSGPTLEEAKKGYEWGPYDKLNPGEVCEGWISKYIPTDWKAEDTEIHFEPMMGSTRCIWILK